MPTVDPQSARSPASTKSSVRAACARPASSSAVRQPLVGASKPSHIEDAVASLEIELTDDEVAALKGPYTPRHDWQGISDPAELGIQAGVTAAIQPGGSIRDDEVVAARSRGPRGGCRAVGGGR